MKNINDDVELENYLREFQPMEPGPLPRVQRRAPLIWAAALVGALLVAILGIRAPHLIRDASRLQAPPYIASTPVDALKLGKLSVAAQQGDEALESALFRSSSAALPRMDRPNTALNALSGE